MDARTLAILDLLHAGYLAPLPGQPDYDRRLAVWLDLYRTRLAATQAVLDAIAASEGDAPCPPSS